MARRGCANSATSTCQFSNINMLRCKPARAATYMNQWIADGIVNRPGTDWRMMMSEWQPIETAPRDGTAFQARIPGHGSDNIIAACDGLLDDNGDDCWSWHFVEDQEPPDCWTDGVCWDTNADGVPSVKPTEWKPLLQAASHD